MGAARGGSGCVHGTGDPEGARRAIKARAGRCATGWVGDNGAERGGGGLNVGAGSAAASN